MAIEIIPTTDQDGAIVAADWLICAEPAHREGTHRGAFNFKKDTRR